LALALAEALAEQVAQCDGAVVQGDEANLPGAPDEWEWAAAAINRVLDRVRSAFWLRAGICMRDVIELDFESVPSGRPRSIPTQHSIGVQVKVENSG
jgi:hypothetical protein